MTNREIARLLRNIAAGYTLLNENRFKIIAYERAADAIENNTKEMKSLWESGNLYTVPGIGPGIGANLEELFKKGHAKHFDEVLGQFPKSLFVLLDVPGIGPKKAYRLTRELHLSDPDSILEDLLHSAKQGKIAKMEGFGEKSSDDIVEAITQYKKGRSKVRRMIFPYAAAISDELVRYLRRSPAVLDVQPLGSLRRNVETIGDIDIAVATQKPREAVEWFLKYPRITDVIEQGKGGASAVLDNVKQVDLRVSSLETFGSMLQYFTGSKQHNIKLREYALKQGLSLSEYGIKMTKKIQNSKFKIPIKLLRQFQGKQNYNSKLKIYEFKTEKEFYNALGIPWIAPELREDHGEIEAAVRSSQGKPNGLPNLVTVSDIKGDFHIHSNYDLESSHDMGASSLEQLLKRAEKLGYEYIGISDHNPSKSKHTKDQIISIMKRRKEYFEHIKSKLKSVRVHLFVMMEVDILPDGKLAIPDEAFRYLDACIVSIHSNFRMDRESMTKRIISGLSHPKAKILAHPTGRLIETRPGYEANWGEINAFCAKEKKALEINAYPQRLDLSDVMAREAIHDGVRVVIGTDSHDVSHMDFMPYGVSVARRGWAAKSDISNTLSYNDLCRWLLT